MHLTAVWGCLLPTSATSYSTCFLQSDSCVTLSVWEKFPSSFTHVEEFSLGPCRSAALASLNRHRLTVLLQTCTVASEWEIFLWLVLGSFQRWNRPGEQEWHSQSTGQIVSHKQQVMGAALGLGSPSHCRMSLHKSKHTGRGNSSVLWPAGVTVRPRGMRKNR